MTPVHLVHDANGWTVCCGRSMWDLPRTDRLSTNPDLTTCPRTPRG